MFYKAADIARKMLVIVIGLIIVSIGVRMYMRSGLGLDAFSVFYQGVSKILHVTIGRSLQICLAVLIVIAFFIDKKVLGIGTLMHAFLLGFFIDLMKLPLPAPTNLFASCAYLAVGVVMEGIGMGIYISAGLGVGAVDAFMLILYKRIKKNLKWARIGVDCTLAVIGCLMGGTLGIGTAVGVAFTGVIIEFTLRLLKAPVLKQKMQKTDETGNS